MTKNESIFEFSEFHICIRTETVSIRFITFQSSEELAEKLEEIFSKNNN